MSKHSKGPWKTVETEAAYPTDDPPMWSVVDADGCDIFGCTNDGDYVYCEAPHPWWVARSIALIARIEGQTDSGDT